MPEDPLVVLTTCPARAQLTRDPKWCVAHSETSAPPAWVYPEEWWIKFQHDHAELLMNKFQEYMIDMSWDKVAGVIPVTSYYIAKHLKNMAPSGNWQIIDFIPSQMGANRPIPELARHRTPIKNLYATGSGWGSWAASSLCRPSNRSTRRGGSTDAVSRGMMFTFSQAIGPTTPLAVTPQASSTVTPPSALSTISGRLCLAAFPRGNVQYIGLGPGFTLVSIGTPFDE